MQTYLSWFAPARTRRPPYCQRLSSQLPMGGKVQLLPRDSRIDVRASGNPRKLLHILGLNSTFTMHVATRMLHPDCPCMGLVVDCSFTEENSYRSCKWWCRYSRHLLCTYIRIHEQGDCM